MFSRISYSHCYSRSFSVNNRSIQKIQSNQFNSPSVKLSSPLLAKSIRRTNTTSNNTPNGHRGTHGSEGTSLEHKEQKRDASNDKVSKASKLGYTKKNSTGKPDYNGLIDGGDQKIPHPEPSTRSMNDAISNNHASDRHSKTAEEIQDDTIKRTNQPPSKEGKTGIRSDAPNDPKNRRTKPRDSST